MDVLVTARAEKNYSSIVEYIRTKWGEATTRQFIQKVDDAFSLLRKYPDIGKIENNDIRGLQITQQTRLIYRVRNRKIYVLSFFDVRQHPGRKLI
jgi:plasmid stabilization system protein ParE